jgi:hypothetical protein
VTERASPGEQVIAVAPAFGEIAAAAPETPREGRRLLEERGWWTERVVARAFGRSREVGGAVARLLPPRRISIEAPAGPPAYLTRVAAEAGIDLSGYTWAMSAAGRYRSNKIVFFLLPPGASRAGYVVKLTRDLSLNRRLDVERDALERLEASAAAPAGTVARVAFSGIEAGRAVLGLHAVDGRAFPEATRGTPDCPDAARAFAWLEDLAASTAFRASGPELAGHLRTLLARTLELYRLDTRHRSVLEGSIDAIGDAGGFPAVFQHGDPGAWNLLVAADGRVAFLDWEAAEPRGVPLWDTFHLARSYAVIAGRKHHGERDAMRAVDRELFRETPINAMLGDVVARYRERLEIPSELVEPLFHTSWMHRALKEATRLAPDRLDDGHYVTLLRRGIDLRGSRAIRRLVGRVR